MYRKLSSRHQDRSRVKIAFSRSIVSITNPSLYNPLYYPQRTFATRGINHSTGYEGKPVKRMPLAIHTPAESNALYSMHNHQHNDLYKQGNNEGTTPQRALKQTLADIPSTTVPLVFNRKPSKRAIGTGSHKSPPKVRSSSSSTSSSSTPAPTPSTTPGENTNTVPVHNTTTYQETFLDHVPGEENSIIPSTRYPNSRNRSEEETFYFSEASIDRIPADIRSSMVNQSTTVPTDNYPVSASSFPASIVDTFPGYENILVPPTRYGMDTETTTTAAAEEGEGAPPNDQHPNVSRRSLASTSTPRDEYIPPAPAAGLSSTDNPSSSSSASLNYVTYPGSISRPSASSAFSSSSMGDRLYRKKLRRDQRRNLAHLYPYTAKETLLHAEDVLMEATRKRGDVTKNTSTNAGNGNTMVPSSSPTASTAAATAELPPTIHTPLDTSTLDPGHRMNGNGNNTTLNNASSVTHPLHYDQQAVPSSVTAVVREPSAPSRSVSQHRHPEARDFMARSTYQPHYNQYGNAPLEYTKKSSTDKNHGFLSLLPEPHDAYGGTEYGPRIVTRKGTPTHIQADAHVPAYRDDETVEIERDTERTMDRSTNEPLPFHRVGEGYGHTVQPDLYPNHGGRSSASSPPSDAHERLPSSTTTTTVSSDRSERENHPTKSPYPSPSYSSSSASSSPPSAIPQEDANKEPLDQFLSIMKRATRQQLEEMLTSLINEPGKAIGGITGATLAAGNAGLVSSGIVAPITSAVSGTTEKMVHQGVSEVIRKTIDEGTPVISTLGKKGIQAVSKGVSGILEGEEKEKTNDISPIGTQNRRPPERSSSSFSSPPSPASPSSFPDNPESQKVSAVRYLKETGISLMNAVIALGHFTNVGADIVWQNLKRGIRNTVERSSAVSASPTETKASKATIVSSSSTGKQSNPSSSFSSPSSHHRTVAFHTSSLPDDNRPLSTAAAGTVTNESLNRTVRSSPDYSFPPGSGYGLQYDDPRARIQAIITEDNNPVMNEYSTTSNNGAKNHHSLRSYYTSYTAPYTVPSSGNEDNRTVTSERTDRTTLGTTIPPVSVTGSSFSPSVTDPQDIRTYSIDRSTNTSPGEAHHHPHTLTEMFEDTVIDEENVYRQNRNDKNTGVSKKIPWPHLPPSTFPTYSRRFGTIVHKEGKETTKEEPSSTVASSSSSSSSSSPVSPLPHNPLHGHPFVLSSQQGNMNDPEDVKIMRQEGSYFISWPWPDTHDLNGTTTIPGFYLYDGAISLEDIIPYDRSRPFPRSRNGNGTGTGTERSTTVKNELSSSSSTRTRSFHTSTVGNAKSPATTDSSASRSSSPPSVPSSTDAVEPPPYTLNYGAGPNPIKVEDNEQRKREESGSSSGGNDTGVTSSSGFSNDIPSVTDTAFDDELNRIDMTWISTMSDNQSIKPSYPTKPSASTGTPPSSSSSSSRSYGTTVTNNFVRRSFRTLTSSGVPFVKKNFGTDTTVSSTTVPEDKNSTGSIPSTVPPTLVILQPDILEDDFYDTLENDSTLTPTLTETEEGYSNPSHPAPPLPSVPLSSSSSSVLSSTFVHHRTFFPIGEGGGMIPDTLPSSSSLLAMNEDEEETKYSSVSTSMNRSSGSSSGTKPSSSSCCYRRSTSKRGSTVGLLPFHRWIPSLYGTVRSSWNEEGFSSNRRYTASTTSSTTPSPSSSMYTIRSVRNTVPSPSLTNSLLYRRKHRYAYLRKLKDTTVYSTSFAPIEDLPPAADTINGKDSDTFTDSRKSLSTVHYVTSPTVPKPFSSSSSTSSSSSSSPPPPSICSILQPSIQTDEYDTSLVRVNVPKNIQYAYESSNDIVGVYKWRAQPVSKTIDRHGIINDMPNHGNIGFVMADPRLFMDRIHTINPFLRPILTVLRKVPSYRTTLASSSSSLPGGVRYYHGTSSSLSFSRGTGTGSSPPAASSTADRIINESIGMDELTLRKGKHNDTSTDTSSASPSSSSSSSSSMFAVGWNDLSSQDIQNLIDHEQLGTTAIYPASRNGDYATVTTSSAAVPPSPSRYQSNLSAFSYESTVYKQPPSQPHSSSMVATEGTSPSSPLSVANLATVNPASTDTDTTTGPDFRSPEIRQNITTDFAVPFDSSAATGKNGNEQDHGKTSDDSSRPFYQQHLSDDASEHRILINQAKELHMPPPGSLENTVPISELTNDKNNNAMRPSKSTNNKGEIETPETQITS